MPTPRVAGIAFAQDWGWGDVGAYGANSNFALSGSRTMTPNLDKLAKSGTLFTDFHTAQAFCAPSRTSWMTGRWPADLHVNTNWNVGPDGAEPNHIAGNPYQLPLPDGSGASPYPGGLPNIAHIMQESGYATAHFGKVRQCCACTVLYSTVRWSCSEGVSAAHALYGICVSAAHALYGIHILRVHARSLSRQPKSPRPVLVRHVLILATHLHLRGQAGFFCFFFDSFFFFFLVTLGPPLFVAVDQEILERYFQRCVHSPKKSSNLV